MTRKSTPSIDRDDLRDQADPERIDRIWDRLEPELASLQTRGEGEARPGRSYRAAWIAAAALAATFAGGVWVGHARKSAPQANDDRAYPVSSSEAALDVFATGSESRMFSLPDGSKLLLQPESTVEVAESAERGMTLRLLHGVGSPGTELEFAL